MACGGVVVVEPSTPAKRRRVRSAATLRRLRHRTRWEEDLVSEVEKEDMQSVRDMISQEVRAELSRMQVSERSELLTTTQKSLCREEVQNMITTAGAHQVLEVAQVLRESLQGLLKSSDVQSLVLRIDALETNLGQLKVHLAELETPRSGTGSRRQLDRVAQRLSELQDEFRDMDTRLEGCEAKVGSFAGVAGDLRPLVELEAEEVEMDGFYSGAYVMVLDVEGRSDLHGMMGMLKAPCDVGWVVRLRTEELIELKESSIRLLDG